MKMNIANPRYRETEVNKQVSIKYPKKKRQRENSTDNNVFMLSAAEHTQQKQEQTFQPQIK